MRYVIIENFKYGLDSRRLAMTSQPGTLAVLENAHVTPGGEIEKRKAFVALTRTGEGATSLAGTMGLEATEDGLVVFGGVPTGETSGWFTAVKVAALPAGVSYIAVIHPYVYAMGWSAYVEAVHALSSVVFSCNYNGKPFVGAKFADGKTYLYYGTAVPTVALGLGTAAIATLIVQSASGIVLSKAANTPATATDLATLLHDQIEALGDDWVATTTGGTVYMYSPAGVYYTPTIVDDSDGVITPATMGYDGKGVSQSAYIKFAVSSYGANYADVSMGMSYNPRRLSSASKARKQTGTTFYFYKDAAEDEPVYVGDYVFVTHADFYGPTFHVVTGIGTIAGEGNYFTYTVATAEIAYIANTSGTFEVMHMFCRSYDASSGGSAPGTATLLARQITSGPDFKVSQITSGQYVQVNADPEWGAFTGVFALCKTGTLTSIATVYTGSMKFSARLSTSVLSTTGIVKGTLGKLFNSGSVTAYGYGGKTPYSYAWTFVENVQGYGDKIQCTNIGGATTKFSVFAYGPGYAEAHWRCTLLDSTVPSNQASADIVVKFSITT
jgi:hypothetical protein